MRQALTSSIAILALLTLSCEAEPDVLADAAPPEVDAAADTGARPADATRDATPPDAAPLDAAPDERIDSGASPPPDVGLYLDASTPDLSVADAERADAGRPDAERPDAERPDAEQPDAEQPDAEQPDAIVLPAIEFCATPEDEDGDGLAGCADPDCRGSPACFHVRETCDDGVDNDGNLDVDCDDGFCVLDPGCPPPDVEPFDTDELQLRFDLECAGCHDNNEPFAGLDLSAPFVPAMLDVPAAGAELDLLKAGDRRQSYLFLKISWRHLEAFGEGEGMPPEHQWNAIDVERLGLWIDAL